MAPIVASTEVARPAEEAFAYVIDLSTMSERQQASCAGTWTRLRPVLGPGARRPGGLAAGSAR